MKIAIETIAPAGRTQAAAAPARALPVARPAADTGPAATRGVDFGARVSRAFGAVEAAASASDRASDELVAGRIDLHEALVQMEKADLTLKLGTTVRNKLLDAYQQLMSSASG